MAVAMMKDEKVITDFFTDAIKKEKSFFSILNLLLDRWFYQIT